MKGPVAIAFTMIMLIPFLLVIPDFAIYGIQSHQASEVASDITKEAEMRGGVTPSLKQYAETRLDETGLKQNGFTVSYDVQGRTEGTVTHSQQFKVTVKGQYQFKAFNFLNTGAMSLAIEKPETGSSKVWKR
jgi:hypothetical protein